MDLQKRKKKSALFHLIGFVYALIVVFFLFTLKQWELKRYLNSLPSGEKGGLGFLSLVYVLFGIIAAIPLVVGGVLMFLGGLGLLHSPVEKSGRGFLILGSIGKIVAVLAIVFFTIVVSGTELPKHLSEVVYILFAVQFTALAVFDFLSLKHFRVE